MSTAALVATEWAVELLNLVKARQWTGEDGIWYISIPRHEERPRVRAAIHEMERAAGKTACVLWVRRRE